MEESIFSKLRKNLIKCLWVLVPIAILSWLFVGMLDEENIGSRLDSLFFAFVYIEIGITIEILLLVGILGRVVKKIESDILCLEKEKERINKKRVGEALLFFIVILLLGMGMFLIFFKESILLTIVGVCLVLIAFGLGWFTFYKMDNSEEFDLFFVFGVLIAFSLGMFFIFSGASYLV